VKRVSLTAWIFIGMAAGVVLGVVDPNIAKQLGPVANVFLRLIRSIVAPLVFATLVVGIAGGGDLKRMGRIGAKAILLFEIVTTLALFLGLAAVNLVRPGEGVHVVLAWIRRVRRQRRLRVDREDATHFVPDLAFLFASVEGCGLRGRICGKYGRILYRLP